MRRALGNELRRVFSSWQFYTAAVLCLGIMILDIYPNLRKLPENRECIMSNVGQFGLSLYFGVIIFAIPVLAGFSYGYSFADEYQSGYLWHSLHRTGIQKYALVKYLAVIMGAALAVGFGMLCFGGVVSLIYLPSDPARYPQHVLPLEDMMWRNLYGIWGGWPYILGQTFLAMLFAMEWAGAGLLVSTLYPNRYVAIASPLVLLYTVMSITQLTGFHFLDPAEMLVQNDLIHVGFAYILGYQTTCITLLGAAFTACVGRRVRHG